MGRTASGVMTLSCSGWRCRLYAALILGPLLAGCGTSDHARTVSGERLYATVDLLLRIGFQDIHTEIRDEIALLVPEGLTPFSREQVIGSSSSRDHVT